MTWIPGWASATTAIQEDGTETPGAAETVLFDVDDKPVADRERTALEAEIESVKDDMLAAEEEPVIPEHKPELPISEPIPEEILKIACAVMVGFVEKETDEYVARLEV